MIMIKVNLALCLTKYHIMKTYGVEVYSYYCLMFDTRERWVVSFTPVHGVSHTNWI